MNAYLDVKVNNLGQMSAPYEYFGIYLKYLFQKLCESRNYIRVDSIYKGFLIRWVRFNHFLKQDFTRLVNL